MVCVLCVGAGVTTEAVKMLSRWTRLGPTLPRILGSGVRFVSQSQKSASAGSATLSELQPPGLKDSHDDGEVNHYVKVSPNPTNPNPTTPNSLTLTLLGNCLLPKNHIRSSFAY